MRPIASRCFSQREDHAEGGVHRDVGTSGGAGGVTRRLFGKQRAPLWRGSSFCGEEGQPADIATSDSPVSCSGRRSPGNAGPTPVGMRVRDASLPSAARVAASASPGRCRL